MCLHVMVLIAVYCLRARLKSMSFLHSQLTRSGRGNRKSGRGMASLLAQCHSGYDLLDP